MINGRGGVLNAQASGALEMDHGLKVSRACWYTGLIQSGRHLRVKVHDA